MSIKKRGFTKAGTIFNHIAGWASILSYIGIPVAAIFVFLKQYFWATGLFLICVIVLSAIGLLKRYRVSVIKFVRSLFAPSSTYRYTMWESRYEYKSDTEMSFHTRYTVRALQTGVDHIRVRFNWSGATSTNQISPRACVSDGCTTSKIEAAGEEYGYKFYNVYNRTAFNKGDPEVKLGVDMDMQEREKKASTHLLTSINVLTDVHHMKVLLPKDRYPLKVLAHEYLHATDDHHWRDCSDECVIEFDENKNKWVISWEIKKPVFGGKYIIYWQT